MIKRSLIALFLMTMTTVVQAKTVNYTCIAESLQAINSDIYFNLSAEQIDEMIQNESALGHEIVINLMTNKCSAQASQN